MIKTADTTRHEPQCDFPVWAVYLVCLGVSFVFMFFFGLNSPLHTFNPHCDYQWYMTMGHGMVSGKVIYRDLFDHKGPITYAIFAFACLFPNPQYAIWCIEILCVSLFLFFCYRIARKFLSPWLSLLVVPLMMMVLSTNYARGIEGSCVEEYCLPIFAYGFLCFLDFLMDRKVVTWRRSFTLGICMGILFWVKYTLLEFFVVPMIIWLIISITEHKFTKLMRNALIMFGGFVLVTIPIIIWFASLGALHNLFEVYFFDNISKYDGSHYQNGAEEVFNPLINFVYSFFIGSYYIIALIWGLICFAVSNWKKKSGWQLLIAGLCTWIMVGFFCGFAYYYLPLFVYAVLGVIYTVKIVAHILQSVEITIQRRAYRITMFGFAIVLSFFVALPFVTNIKEINRPRENYAPLVVADMIAEYNQTATRPATLFCYSMADVGFYNAAGVVPNVRYFAESSFTKTKFPEMFASFDETISEQLCDFVIVCRSVYENKESFFTNYYHPYLNHNLDESTVPYSAFEPGGYIKTRIVVLFRNE